MVIILENEVIEVHIETMGAELIHVIDKETGYDYMWSGDERYWTGRSPVLFPVIGGLYQGVVKVNGKEFAMKNHGFARKSEFSCCDSDDLSAKFKLVTSDVTLSQYPFKFQLELLYTLTDYKVSIDYNVYNKDDQTMPFQIGTHPAFNCPFGSTEQLDEWFLEFEKKETLSRIGLRDNLINLEDVEEVLDHSSILALDHKMFYTGAIVFRGVKSKFVVLKSDNHNKAIKVSYDNLPDMGIWQPKDAPFMCIEPWYGHGDTPEFDGDIMEKERMIHLLSGEVYHAQLGIEIVKG